MEFTKDIEFNHCPTAEQELILTYHGALKNSAELTIVYGFGDAWQQTTQTPMKKKESGFCVKVPMMNFDTFNFCFKNSNNEWDNNCNCNYISPILPCAEEVPEKFDIDALIEEILQPILAKPIEVAKEPTPIKIDTKPIDLGVEISNILSEINFETAPQDLIEYSTLDEILAGTVIEQTPIDLFEDEINNEIDIPTIEHENEETALLALKDPFTISPRRLSKFYFIRKQIKLSLYKLFVKLPKLIFGSQEQ